ncbi:MAG: hypothetical protein KJO31_15435 [Gammaproteobacteria bacterium]|nr:hypothetical protein [Gammaproteobacteria bacterium]
MKNLTIAVIVTVLSFIAGGSAVADDNHGSKNAVTLWWVIFNNPDACSFNPGGAEKCGTVDVFGQEFLDSIANGSPDPSLISPNIDAGLAVLYGTGGISNRRGKLDLVASIYRTPAAGLTLTGPSIADPMGFGRGFENPEAEVHLVLRDHGRRVRRGELEQISGFLDPYCSDPNLLYFAGPNICADIQFAIFGATESGRDKVYAFGETPAEVHGASAVLIRNGDLIQAIVTTRL